MSVLFGSLLQPLVSGKGAAPVQAAAIGPIHWRWWSRGQADVNAGSQHGDLSLSPTCTPACGYAPDTARATPMARQSVVTNPSVTAG